MSRMKQDFELLVSITSYIRLVLIVGVLLVNFVGLVKLIFGSRADWLADFCVHRIVTGLIIVSNVTYLTTWFPYLIWSTFNGYWPFASSREHCIIQNSITNHVTTLLLTILSILKLYDVFTVQRARLLSLALIFGWVVPQALYLTLTDLINPERSSHQFADRLLYTPNHLAVNGASHANHIGFMLCITRLESPVVAQLSWHYLVIVIPLTTIIFLSSVAEALKENQSKSDPSYCYCHRDFPVLLTLYFNLMWLIILRPLIILQTLVLANKGNSRNSSQQLSGSPDYLDFGTHLVLIFSSLLVPFSGYGGFRTSPYYHHHQVTLVNKQQQMLSAPNEIDYADGGGDEANMTCDLDSIGSQSCSSSICQQDNESINGTCDSLERY